MTEAVPDAVPPARPNDDVYGLLRMAGMDVALPLSALREVVPCPVTLAGLPAAAVGLLGAMELRRLVLPVLDLRPVLGLPSERQRDQVVVVVASGGQVLGLLADEVRGISQVPGSALVAARAEGGGLLFSHTFRHPDDGTACSVLDAAAVLSLPGVPTVTDLTRDAAAGAGQGATGGDRRTLTVLRCGAYRFAVEAEHVHTTLPRPDLRPSVLRSTLCAGVVEFAEREVPVVDPLALLGLGELPREDIGAGLVLDLGHGYVVLALSALLELTDIDGADVLPTPTFAFPRPDLLAGMVDVDGLGDCLLLDGHALLADGDLAGFASVNAALDTAPADRTEGTAAVVPAAAPSYLTYSVGVDVATPLDQVAEILPFPETVTATPVDGVLGLITHRRAAVPVLCLATLLGRPERPVGATTCLLLVAVDDVLVAFAVDALRTIAPLVWTDAEQAVRGAPEDRGATLPSAPLVRVGEDTRLLPDLDLRTVARRLAGRSARPAGAPAGQGRPLVHS